MSQINDVFVQKEKEQQINISKTEEVSIEKNKQGSIEIQPISENKEPLMADEKIKSLSQEKQIKKTVFDKTGFMRDVKKLNEKSRGVDPLRMAEKGYLVRDLYQMKAMKIKDSTGKEKKLPSDIRDFLKLLDQYTGISPTAVQNSDQRGYGVFGVLIWAFKIAFNLGGNRSTIAKEHELMGKMVKKLGKLIPKYEHESGYEEVVKRLKNLQTRLTYQSGAVASGKSDSAATIRKRKWNNYNPESRQINGVGRKIKTTADDNGPMKWVLEKDVVEDRSDQPLFAHRPSYEDICQGAAGNCFFLAARAAIPGEQIRRMMLDNGNGTVTVRFYEKDAATGRRNPVYVTVDKKVKINASLDCLWVQVMEKAYALFRQNRANNKMVFDKRQEKDPQTGEMVCAPEKTIADDVIDLGYLANGGQSQDVLSDLLGTESEYINVYQTAETKKVGQICREALQHTDEKGAAYLEIKKIRNAFKQKVRRISKLVEKQGKCLEEYSTFEDELDTYKMTIASLENEIKDTTDPKRIEYLKDKIRKTYKDMDEDQKEIAPIKGILYEYFNAKKQADAKINELKKKYNIQEKNKKDTVAVDAYDIIGMEKEADEAAAKVMDYLDKKTTLLVKDDEKAYALQLESFTTNTKSILSNFLINYIENLSVEMKFDSAKATVTQFQKFIREVKRRVAEDDQDFVKMATKYDKIGSLLNGNNKEGLKITKEFMIPLLDKMIDNFVHVDGIHRAYEIGEEDAVTVQYFNKLTEMIKNRQCVCIGTNEVKGNEEGVAGEGMDKGMVGGHAYTVLDTTVTKSGARMVLLRNPWAAYAVKYKKNKKGILETLSVKTENGGMFWIEMNHLMKYLGDIHGSGKPEVA